MKISISIEICSLAISIQRKNTKLNFRKRDVQTVRFNSPLPYTSTVDVHSKRPMNLLQNHNQTLKYLDIYNTKFIYTLGFLNTDVSPPELKKFVFSLNKKNSHVLQILTIKFKKIRITPLTEFYPPPPIHLLWSRKRPRKYRFPFIWFVFSLRRWYKVYRKWLFFCDITRNTSNGVRQKKNLISYTNKVEKIPKVLK